MGDNQLTMSKCGFILSLLWSNGLVLSELVCPVCLQNSGNLNWKTCYSLSHALLFYRLAGCMPFRRAAKSFLSCD